MGGIVWLASYPKSGNTWMRAFLQNLLLDGDEPANINELDAIFFGDSQLNWYEPYLEGRSAQDLSDAEIMDLRSKMQEGFAKSRSESVFVKTHNLLGSVGGKPLVDLRWTAGAIYILRNPLDVVLSLSDHAGLSIDDTIEMMGNRHARTETDHANVFEVHGGWSRNVETWTHHESPGLTWVRYEDMQENPVQTFGNICAFLGLNVVAEKLEKAVRFSSFDTLRSQEDSAGFREKPMHASKFFRSGQSGQWQDTLSKSQIDQIVRDHEQQMTRFGYLP